MITLYNENDVQIRDIRIYEINDADMGESTITTTVKFDQVMQFHPDWYVLLNGEKYKLGITEPSGKRSTTKINVEYTLTFHSSREDLKRYTFMDFVEYGSGNPQPSQHTFSLQACTLGQLVNRFNINLQYYLGSLWTMELSDDADPNIVADLSFDKASLWDVLLELYKDYGVRWTIRSNEGYMTILVGEDATELQTIFEYGKGSGLISVERTNPTERIVTRLRGKGSEKNLPANYFHAATSAFPIADPDTNSILQGIFYNRLYPKCYRDYVRGYNSGEEDVEETWAYHQGVADKIAGKPMNIVDFAKSDKEALWGISYGAVEDNDEIYPTLQGATRNGVELDKVLAVSPIYVDAPDDGAAARQFTQVNGAKGSFQGRDISIRVNGRDGGISSVLGISNAKSATADSETFTLETDINTVRAKFLVTPTKFADYYANAVDVTDPESPTLTTVVEMAANNWNFVESLQLINATTGAVVRTWNGNNQDFFDVVADDIPAGTYKFRSYIQWYKTTGTTTDYLLYTIDWQLYGCEYASYQNASSKKTFSETFDIWIGNVWNTSKQESESDEAYACRVWAPLVSKEEMTVMFSDGLLAGEDYEFPIVGLVNDSDNLAEIIKKAIHYDTSVTGSHWRLTLQKSDAEFEASGKYLPNSVINVLPGNHFFFINIQMPYDPYIYDAERRQQEYLEDQLSLLDVEQPTFAVVPASVFMASLDEVDNVVPGNKIRLRDAALIGSSYTTAYIQSISKKYTENKINPDWSLVVSDQILVNGNPITLIEGKVDALSKQMYSSKQAIKDATEAFAQFYLRKDGLPDASFSATDFRAPVTFRDRITDYNFRQGDFGGYGFGVYTDPDGNRVVEADVLVGRTALRVNELIVNQVEYVGGQKIYSAAAMTVSKVESTDTIWRCYFDNKQGAVRNMFLAGDLAFCQRFNGTEEGGYTTYWAKVTAIGSDYIELSKTDLMSAGSGSPAVGDNIIQLGNASDQDRQSAIILSSYGANSPSIRLYYGITDYTLANKDIFGVEYDSTNHIPYFYNYGSMRLGAKEGEDGGYIAYDHKSKKLKINAIVNFLPQSTGLEQMESYQKLVKIAQGNIETWFYDGVSPIQSGAPTMSNYPVNTWEAADYENHIGDIYYSNTGKGYRFKRSGSTWEWEIISDAEMAQLMAEVQNLQYLKTALSDGTTTVAGGLILTSLIQLGYKDAQDVRHTMAGISGLGQNSTAPAAWFGGPMVDHELNPNATEFAKSLFRFDGTGYLANGNITWDEKGYGQVGGEGDNYALKWNDKEVRIGPNIKLGAGDETMAMLVNLLNMFELDTTSVAGKTLIHAKYDGLYSDGDIAAGGAFAGTPSGGGNTYLNELLDVQLATSSLNVGDMLMWNGVKYVNIPQSSITPDLSSYATQQWVLSRGYITSVPVTSVVGQTGNITAAQVATALTDAGYKLTDTTYGLATNASNGLMSATDKTKLDGIDANANNYTLPTASSSTRGGIKVGTTLSISGEVLDLKSGFPKGTYTKVQIDDYGRVSSGSTLSASDIPSLPWSKITSGKPTTISGYGITDAYTKTETDNKVGELQRLLDSMFVRVYDSENKLIRIHSNVIISSSGDLVAGGNSEGGTPSGGAFTQLEWNAIKALTQSESGLLASAYSVKEAYNELNTAIETLAGKATAVSFSQAIASGVEIGTITIDTKSTKIYSPSLAALMGSTAIGGESAYPYWNGSAWATKALGSNAFTSISKVSQLTNDSGYITGITKAMVESVLTGNITSHTHSYLPLSGGTMSNTDVVTNLNADLLDGYHHSSFAKVASPNDLIYSGNEFTFVPSAFSGIVHLNYRTAGGTDGAITQYSFDNGAGGILATISAGQFSGNAASSTQSPLLSNTSDAKAVSGVYFHRNNSSTSLVGNTEGNGVWGHPSDSQEKSFGNASILRIGWNNAYYTDIFTGPNPAGGKYGLQWRQIADKNVFAWRILLDSSNLKYYGAVWDYDIDLTGHDKVANVGYGYTSKGWYANGSAISFGANANFNHQILGAVGTGGQLLHRNVENGSVGSWMTILDSSNYNSYAPKLDGTGASGTWNINIQGFAFSAYALKRLALPTSGTSDGPSLIYTGGQYTIGPGEGNAYEGVSTDYNLWSYPKNATAVSSTVANIQTLRLSWDKTKYWHDIFLSPNNSALWHRSVSNGSTTDWYRIVEERTNTTWGINISGNATSATQLQTSRTIWGQSFNGTGNVSGALSGVTDINKVLHINSSGNVGIGTTSPSYKLHIDGTGYYSGNIVVDGDLAVGSDIRYKDKINNLGLSVHDIALAPAFAYKWKDKEDDLTHIGTSAQYWLGTNAKDAVCYDKEKDFYRLNYSALALCNTIILARGMETQEQKITRLENRVKELEDKVRQYKQN